MTRVERVEGRRWHEWQSCVICDPCGFRRTCINQLVDVVVREHTATDGHREAVGSPTTSRGAGDRLEAPLASTGVAADHACSVARRFSTGGRGPND